MTKNRLEAFSDGVIAIIITIMVLELRPPHGFGLEELRPLIPKLLSYTLSFAFLGIYWNNHHHLLHGAKRVSGGVLWLNMLLLFWLSLIPFGTAWLGEQGIHSIPVMVYGALLLGAGCSYFVLAQALAKLHGPDSEFAQALGKDLKGTASMVIYLTGIALSQWLPQVAVALYVSVAFLWLVPDKRFEKN